MITDARTLVSQARIDADVCIAGAGAAGITLAHALIESGLRVVVVESGDLVPDVATQDLYRAVNDTPWYSLADTRLRYFGGTTNHWSGWCRPLEAEDFSARHWLPGSGWPLTSSELAPYYDRARAICEIAPLDFDATRLATLVAKPLLPVDPDRIESIVYLYSPPTRFGERYRDDLVRSDNTTVYLNANLVNIQLTPNGGAVASFDCATLTGVTFRVAAARYVLALGGVENARILLASNSQTPAGVGNDTNLVGRFFMEHPQTALFWSALLLASSDADWSLYSGSWLVSGVACNAALQIAPSLRASLGLAGMGITLGEAPMAGGSAGGFTINQLRGLLRSSGTPRLLAVTIRTEQRPVAENRITLSGVRDALGVPRPSLEWRIVADDMAGIARGLELLGREIGRAGLGRLWTPLEAGSDFSGDLEGAAHHMGTTRMATLPADGVVDSDGRVFGVSNLYIAGSSVFPTAGYANPTLTIVALTLRLADHLQGVA